MLFRGRRRVLLFLGHGRAPKDALKLQNYINLKAFI
jgi:hypothetical protein